VWRMCTVTALSVSLNSPIPNPQNSIGSPKPGPNSCIEYVCRGGALLALPNAHASGSRIILVVLVSFLRKMHQVRSKKCIMKT
jgi:hypothetical protein